MILLFLLMGISATSAVEVNFYSAFEIQMGWHLVCAWKFPADDRLQSVKLYRDNVLFRIYRPEIHTGKMRDEFNVHGTYIKMSCSEERNHGNCTLDVEPLLEPERIVIFTCEVSGERPKFKIVAKNVALEPFVQATDAVIETVGNIENDKNRAVLNCSSTGIPAPTLSWSVKGTEVPADFTDQGWNSTLKLMEVWSSLSLSLKPGERLDVICLTKQKKSPTGYITGLGSSVVLEDSRVNSAKCFGRDFRIGALMIIFCFLR